MGLTAPSPERLSYAGGEWASAALGQCQECGFCTLHCPTYLLLGDERDSPRGRVRFAREIVVGGAAPTPEAVRHLDRCLSCLACSSACPFGVDHKRLWDASRAAIETSPVRSSGERAARRLLARLLASPRMFHRALRLAPLGRLARPLLPARLRRMLDVAPPVATALAPVAATTVAEGPRRMRVALLGGCVQQVLGPAINAATVRLLARHGCEVVVPRSSGCCGAIALHMGQPDDAKALAMANVAAWQGLVDDGGLDAVIVSASGCGSVVKDYADLLHDTPLAKSASRIAAMARDVSEVAAELSIAWRNPAPGMRVALHLPCSMQHGQGIALTPQRLLERAGFDVRQPANGHVCCGSAGTYNILQPELSDQLGRDKGRDLDGASADVVATANLGCQMHVARFARTPIVHVVELLDWASGGPRPPALKGARA